MGSKAKVLNSPAEKLIPIGKLKMEEKSACTTRYFIVQSNFAKIRVSLAC